MAQQKKKSPVEPVMLLTLTEAQAALVSEAMTQVEIQSKAVEDARARLNQLLSMVRPEGANSFNPKTMTFYSVTPSEPKENEDA